MSNKLAGIKEGNIVRVKFRPIPDITKEMKMSTKLQCLDDHDIGANINILMIGGDFVVVGADNADKKQKPYIKIDNHHDGGTFLAYDEIIDTIEVIEVANKFYSDEHGILMIQVDDKMYVNGEILENTDDKYTNEKDKNMLDKFTAFMEKFLVARAFEGSLDVEEE